MEPVCKCEVPEKSPGVIFCERHDCEKTRAMAQLCQAGQRGESPGVRFWQAWEEGRGPGQWTPDMPSRGLGDTIAKATHAVGVKPCKGCGGRQKRLNKRFPYRQRNQRRFVTLDELKTDTLGLLAKLPPDLDAVVGVARSGLIPATLLATALHLPLYAVNGHGVADVGDGTRLKQRGAPAGCRTVLVIDDTGFRGTAMRRFPPIVARVFTDARLLKAVIYCSPEARSTVDLFAVSLRKPHWLEWHWFNSPHVAQAAFDFDGILCHDPEAGENDDGPRYRAFLEHARPKYVPRHTVIPLVVTARLDRPEYRRLTEKWLARWRIKVARLVMGPWSSVRSQNPRNVARFKAGHYRRCKLPLFVESDPRQARMIAEQTDKRVLCPAAGKVF